MTAAVLITIKRTIAHRFRLIQHGLGIALIASSLIACGTASFSSLQLGTTIHITLFNTQLNTREWQSIETQIDAYDQLFSTYPNAVMSQLKKLNASAGTAPVEMNVEVIDLLSIAQGISLETNNAFALCIEPLVSLWGIGTVHAQVPDAAAIQNRLSLLDPHDLLLTESSAFLKHVGMGIDLGGIAKGYIAEKIAQELKTLGVAQALLDFGGNIVSIGLKNDAEQWRVGIRNPRGIANELVGAYEIGADTAVVTSGDYERYFEQDDVRYHHILDATTGYPSTSDLTSTTIISSDAVLADALSTASFVMGARQAAQLQDRYPGTEFIFIGVDASIWVSNPDAFTLLDEAFVLRDWNSLKE